VIIESTTRKEDVLQSRSSIVERSRLNDKKFKDKDIQHNSKRKKLNTDRLILSYSSMHRRSRSALQSISMAFSVSFTHTIAHGQCASARRRKTKEAVCLLDAKQPPLGSLKSSVKIAHGQCASARRRKTKEALGSQEGRRFD